MFHVNAVHAGPMRGTVYRVIDRSPWRLTVQIGQVLLANSTTAGDSDKLREREKEGGGIDHLADFESCQTELFSFQGSCWNMLLWRTARLPMAFFFFGHRAEAIDR